MLSRLFEWFKSGPVLNLEAGVVELFLRAAEALDVDLVDGLEEILIDARVDGAGVALAERVLQDTPFLPEEKAMILNAVRFHRSADAGHDEFSLLICQADKASRNCFLCAASDTCYWEKDKRNMYIKD